jgi:hypothetical protein
MNLDGELFDYIFGYIRSEVAATLSPVSLAKVLCDCAEERAAQDRKWGDQSDHHLGGFFAILAEEHGEVAKEVCELIFSPPGPRRNEIGARLRGELVQTMAVCAAFIEAGDEKGWGNWPFETHLKHVGKDEG